MEVLRARFRGRASEDVDRLNTALSSCNRVELVRISHALAGNAGLFGFLALGQQAARVEKAVEANESVESVTLLVESLTSALQSISDAG